MALKARLPNLDGLSEAIRNEYREVDGVFLLDVTPVDGYALEDINGLKSTLGKNKTEITELKAKVQAIGDLDPAAARTAIEKLKSYGNLSADELAKEKVKSALDQQQAQFNDAHAKSAAKIATLTNHLSSTLIDGAAATALAAKGGNVKLLLPHLKSSSRVVETETGFKVEILDAEGNPRIHVGNGKTSDMTLEQLVEEMSVSTDFADAFKSTAKTGNNTRPNAQTANTTRPRVISANDQNGMNSSLEDIAKGTVVVEMS